MTRAAGTAAPLPVATMMWTVNDPVIESAALLDEQYADIRAAGFDGITAMVRCSSYAWCDPAARRALRRIGALCKRDGLAFWVVADPRQSATRHPELRGTSVVTCLDSTGPGGAMQMASVEQGRFSLRCALRPRPSHILTESAVHYEPDGLLGAWAWRGLAAYPEQVIDVTRHTTVRWNEADRALDAAGEVAVPAEEEWNVLVLFRLRSNVFDFGDRASMAAYLRDMDALAADGVAGDALLWDEPGYLCLDGCFVDTPALRNRLRRTDDTSFARDAWKLVLGSRDFSHVAFRNAYYEAVQHTVNRAQKTARAHAARSWGRGTLLGMHDTWRWESALIADRNHGTLDLWRALESKQCGFVDLGSVNLLDDPASPFHANFAAMSVAAVSLARHSERRAAYNNLWITGEDDGSDRHLRVMEHCARVLALFGVRWSAHLYGPAGLPGNEDSFLGLPFTPGYPRHSTWQGMPRWTALLKARQAVLDGALPMANLLVVFPIETLYAEQHDTASLRFAALFELLLALLDEHYHPALLSPSALGDLRWEGGAWHCNGARYEAVILPGMSVLPSSLAWLLRCTAPSLYWLWDAPQSDAQGWEIPFERQPDAVSFRTLFHLLETKEALRPCIAPARSWVTVTQRPDGDIVSIAPSRSGIACAGQLRYDGRSVLLPEAESLRSYRFPRDGEAEPLS